MKSTIEAALFLVLVAAPVAADPVSLAVKAFAETEGTTGDADDPAIWVNAEDPGSSLILGTDKTAGLYAYRLDGSVHSFLPDGKLNNVDLRPFILDGRPVTLAGATKREDDTLVFYILDSTGIRHAEPFAHQAIPPELAGIDDIYGFAMAQDSTGTYALVNFKSGHVLQYLVEDRAGQLHLTLQRDWKVASQPEGMVADDAAGFIYIGEEDRGIWRYPLGPSSPPEATVIDTIPSACLPRDDVEGLAVQDGPGGRYLIASAQGIHRAAIYRLSDDALPTCVALAEVVPGGVDGVTETDGLAASPAALPDHPEGILVMMDDQNAGYTTNFKLIDWAELAAGLR